MNSKRARCTGSVMCRCVSARLSCACVYVFVHMCCSRDSDCSNVQSDTVVSRERLLEILARAPPKENLVGLLSDAFHMGKEVAEHCVRLAKLEPKRCPEKAPMTGAETDALLVALDEGAQLLRSLKSGDEITRGFLMLAPAGPAEPEPALAVSASGDVPTEPSAAAVDQAKQEVAVVLSARLCVCVCVCRSHDASIHSVWGASATSLLCVSCNTKIWSWRSLQPFTSASTRSLLA